MKLQYKKQQPPRSIEMAVGNDIFETLKRGFRLQREPPIQLDQKNIIGEHFEEILYIVTERKIALRFRAGAALGPHEKHG